MARKAVKTAFRAFNFDDKMWDKSATKMIA